MGDRAIGSGLSSSPSLVGSSCSTCSLLGSPGEVGEGKTGNRSGVEGLGRKGRTDEEEEEGWEPYVLIRDFGVDVEGEDAGRRGLFDVDMFFSRVGID